MALIIPKEKDLMAHTNPSCPLYPPYGKPIYFQGPDINSGARPAVIYFALSAEMSLFQDPFNQPVLRLAENDVRVFSWDLPFHEIGKDPREAIQQWIDAFINDPSFVSEFLHQSKTQIDFLIQKKLVIPEKIAIAGLSRGAFLASHLAAHDPRITSILGFAPLTNPQAIEELNTYGSNFFDKIALNSLSERLIHKRLRFYIGNRDVRVGTDTCYFFIRHLTETAFNHGIRSPSVELMIYPSIGHKGHGTPPAIFNDGADWIKEQLL